MSAYGIVAVCLAAAVVFAAAMTTRKATLQAREYAAIVERARRVATEVSTTAGIAAFDFAGPIRRRTALEILGVEFGESDVS